MLSNIFYIKQINVKFISIVCINVMVKLFFLPVLPELRSSDKDIDKSKPLPTSLQSDFIPEDILFSLVQPPVSYDKLGPPSRYRNLHTSVVIKCISCI